MVAEAIVTGVSIAMGVLLLVALGHKLSVLVHGRAGEQPLLQTGDFRRRHPDLTLGAAAVAEAAIATLLVALPVVGLLAMAFLLALYARELSRLSPSADCNCFGAVSRIQASSARTRNIGLIAACLATGVLAVASGADFRLSGAGIGVAFVVLAAIGSSEAVSRLQVQWRQEAEPR